LTNSCSTWAKGPKALAVVGHRSGVRGHRR
jgi:hypothetical protein